MPNWLQLALALLTGSALTAIINNVGEGKRQKRALAKDEETENDLAIKKLKKEMEPMKEGLKYLMMYRIEETAKKYCDRGEVSFNDRRILVEAHKCYHDGLGGNGDLNDIMDSVKELPLKN